MNKLMIKIICTILLPFAIMACTEANYGDESLTRITKSDLDPSFTVVSVSANKYKLTPTNNKNVLLSELDLGIGSFTSFNTGDTLFIPDAGIYNIRRFVVGAGGISSDTISKTITVATSDPVKGNLVVGGKFTTPADVAKWAIGGSGSGAGVWTFTPGTTISGITTPGKATLTAGGYAGNGIYQAINITGGFQYKIDMLVSSTTGLSDSWFEVYCDYTNPTTVTGDYSAGGTIYSINTWNGSGKTPFSGKISIVGTPTKMNGVFTATTTGTVYLVIRGGGNNMQAGVSVTNVEFRRM
jgi:hypothetical protein